MSRRKAATEGPMPADFAEHAFGRIKDLRKRYNARYELIVAWRAELGLTGAMVRKKVLTGVGRREIPEGFAEYRTATSLRATAKHFKMNLATARRMSAELGIKPKSTGVASLEPKTAPKPKLARKAMNSTFTQTAPIARPFIDPTPAGQAAEFLRQFGPVIRCNEQRQYDPAGNYWLRGSFLLTAEDIIHRAERNGWTGGRMAA